METSAAWALICVFKESLPEIAKAMPRKAARSGMPNNVFTKSFDCLNTVWQDAAP